ncbi:MAG: alpha/beta hydrolase [Planctomycetota bacterium]
MTAGKKILRVVWLIVRIVTGVYVLSALLLYVMQSRYIYYPTPDIEATPDLIGLPYEDLTFKAADGVTLTGWFVPAEKARGVVLLFHGNGGNIGHRIDTLGIFNSLGLSTFIIDYRGYGRSEGKPSEKGTYLDAEAAWNYLTGERGIEPEQIILFGRSMGGVFASYLAKDRAVAGVIVESCFTSAVDMGAELFPLMPVRLLSRYKYPAADYLSQATCPVLVIHSPDDDIIPFHYGQRLFDAAPEPKTFLQIAGSHNDGFLLSGRTYTDGLDTFISERLGK